MKPNKYIAISTSSLFLLCLSVAQAETLPITQLIVKQGKEVAPSDGWAGQAGGTTGGSLASWKNIYTVSSAQQLRDVVNAAADQPKIIQIKGTIDISNGIPYKNFADQKKRSQLAVPANTTLIGIGKEAKFIHGSLLVNQVQNVILRNFTVEMPVDVAPHYEQGDGWNAEWDGITIEESQHVWVDHLTLTDGSFTDDQYKQKDGETWTQHDGMLDIKRGSDFVTISWSDFNHHDKTMLIGHSDGNGAQDTGKLHVTIHDSVFELIEQRSPRVRFGQVHSFNNLFMGDAGSRVPAYRYQYSYGVGVKGSIISENNQFSINGLSDNCKIVKAFGKDGNSFSDKGSYAGNSAWLGGTKCAGLSVPKWKIPYTYRLIAVSQVLQRGTTQAGAGKM
ncbi:pectate lyase [Rosenbergiella nectarea]|uniref:Pectate lyase n=1 Tax=Rosenbergiella nectarea TaxID=988801 RepID=A0A1H9F4Q1_9GAMM|nr:pectate lyase [Rosenbergiella nectarea]SEQ32984.1 pectate lyase [Rosenbergiella nectarea]